MGTEFYEVTQQGCKEKSRLLKELLSKEGASLELRIRTANHVITHLTVENKEEKDYETRIERCSVGKNLLYVEKTWEDGRENFGGSMDRYKLENLESIEVKQ